MKHNNNIEAYLYLSRICEKQDDVEGSLAALRKAQEVHPNEPRLDIALGRVYDQLQEAEKAHEYYKRALAVENCNAEAVANIAAYYFYKDQPEISLKMYQRLVELGCESVEIWNNMALCCFGNHQYHLYYTCFQRALLLAQDHPDLHADVWYNIGYVYAQFGELEMAGVAFRVALGLQPDHPEALGNVAVVEARQGRVEAAINYAEKSYRESANFEAAYNLSLWYLQTNQLEKASEYNRLALGVFPGHAESRALAGRLLRKLEAL